MDPLKRVSGLIQTCLPIHDDGTNGMLKFRGKKRVKFRVWIADEMEQRDHLVSPHERHTGPNWKDMHKDEEVSEHILLPLFGGVSEPMDSQQNESACRTSGELVARRFPPSKHPVDDVLHTRDLVAPPIRAQVQKYSRIIEDDLALAVIL